MVECRNRIIILGLMKSKSGLLISHYGVQFLSFILTHYLHYSQWSIRLKWIYCLTLQLLGKVCIDFQGHFGLLRIFQDYSYMIACSLFDKFIQLIQKSSHLNFRFKLKYKVTIVSDLLDPISDNTQLKMAVPCQIESVSGYLIVYISLSQKLNEQFCVILINNFLRYFQKNDHLNPFKSLVYQFMLFQKKIFYEAYQFKNMISQQLFSIIMKKMLKQEANKYMNYNFKIYIKLIEIK